MVNNSKLYLILRKKIWLSYRENSKGEIGILLIKDISYRVKDKLLLMWEVLKKDRRRKDIEIEIREGEEKESIIGIINNILKYIYYNI